MKTNPTPTVIPEPIPGESRGAARRVAVNTFNPFAAQVFTRVLMLGYAIVQYRVIAAGTLGDYFVAGIILLYTSTIAEWGLGTYLTREVAKERSSYPEVSALFHRTLGLRLAISLALFVPVAVVVVLYVSLFGLTIPGAWAVGILTLSLLPGAFSGACTSILYAYERMSLPAVVGIGTSLLNVALGVGAMLLGWGIIGLAGAALAATAVTSVVFLSIMSRNFPGLDVWPDFSGVRLEKATAVPLLKAGWPLMLNALLVGLFFRIDQFIVQPVLGSERVAQYQAAYSFINFVLLITPAVTLALFPRMARNAVNDRKLLAYEYGFVLKALLLLAVPIMALTIWFAPLLITIFTGGKAGYLPASAVALQILVLFLPFSFVNGVTQYVLIALDKQRLITVAFAITVVFNVAANLALVPVLGINGAAITTVLSEIVLIGPFVWWASRELGGVPILAFAWRPAVGAAVLLLLGMLLQPFANSWNASASDFALYVALGVLLAALYLAVVFGLRPFSGAELGSLRAGLRR